MRRLLLTLVLLGLAVPAVAQRQLTTPRVSPHARVMQTVGMTDLTVDFHRPAVNDRAVWGDLVPYGTVWRAGANENTTFEASTDVMIEGDVLPAGRYGLHTIPGETEWTVIFSSMADAWGSYSYAPSEDALRVTVTPRSAPMQERLGYRFDAPSLDSATLVLYWERLEVPVSVSVATPTVVLASMERELRGVPGFFPEGWEQIASYALDNELRLDDALVWAEASIERNASVSNQLTKARALEALGRADEAQALRVSALSVADSADVDAYAQARRRAGRADEADQILELYESQGSR